MPFRRCIEWLIAAWLLAGCSATGGLDRLRALVPDAPETVATGTSHAGFDVAVAALREGDYAAAERAFADIAADHPDAAGARINLAILYLRTGRQDEALAAADAALAINDNHAPAHNLRGILLRQSGDFAAAETAYLAALEADPGHAHAWRNLGVLYDLYLQRPHEAVQAYERYQALVNEPDREVALWIKDLTRRFGEAPRAALVRQP